MKTEAQDYYEQFIEIFSEFDDNEIVEAFNFEVGTSGWVTARASYFAALHSEFDRRKIDYSLIGDAKTLSFKDQITLVGKKIILLDPTTSIMEDSIIAKPKKSNPKIKVDEQIIEEAKNQNEVEKQVVVHCFFKSHILNTSIRIWKSTYLRDQDSTHKSKLLSAHNITIYPEWMPTQGGSTIKFTLVFSALPKNCKSFDLFEDIPEEGGFYSEVISRNKSDVYSVEILS